MCAAVSFAHNHHHGLRIDLQRRALHHHRRLRQEALRAINATHREVSRDLIDRILANPMAIAKNARIVPAMKDGKPNGFKLYAIRPRSVYVKLGLGNGDTIVSVNGTPIDSADKALEVYTKLRAAKTLVLQLERRGKPVTLTITIK